MAPFSKPRSPYIRRMRRRAQRSGCSISSLASNSSLSGSICKFFSKVLGSDHRLGSRGEHALRCPVRVFIIDPRARRDAGLPWHGQQPHSRSVRRRRCRDGTGTEVDTTSVSHQSRWFARADRRFCFCPTSGGRSSPAPRRTGWDGRNDCGQYFLHAGEQDRLCFRMGDTDITR